MFESSALIVFVTAAFILLITPGPAVLFIVARSLEQGRLAGVVSALGIGSAALVHVVVAALGLSAILVQSAVAFNVIKYAGATYLIFLGVRTLMSGKPQHTEDHSFQAQPLQRIFWQGFVVNLFNPKTALFFFAFLPQFVNPEQGSVTLQVIILGMIFVVMAITSDTVFALAAGTARSFLSNNPRVSGFQTWFAGMIYIGLGVTTALTGSRTK